MADKNMRIMLVVNEFPPQKFAGTAVATRELALMLRKRGHQVHVVVTTDCLNESRDAVAPGLHVSWMADRPFKGIGILWRLWHLWRIAGRWRPDILQGQSVSCGLLAALVGKGLGIPSFVYAQGQDVYQASRLQRCTEVRWACRLASKVGAVSRHLSASLVTATGCEDVCVIPHGFHLLEPGQPRDALRGQRHLSEAQKVVLSVGRLERIKGQDVLLDAWPRVLKAVPSAELWLVGEGAQRHALEAQADALGITNTVHFMGQKDAACVAECMAAADLFVLPSRSEAFGIVLLEAMAHALPVVASRVGGVPEVLPRHGDATLVEPEDVDGLASAIVRALRQDRYPSAVNREWAMRFEWEHNVVHFEDIYRELVR